MSVVINTQRLCLTELGQHQAQFVYDLFNDPDCIRFIGDRGIDSLAAAQDYLRQKLIASYQTHGYGLFQVSFIGSDEPLGICGLVKRDEDNPPDIGFAFLPAFRGGGLCTEAGAAVLDWAQEHKISNHILAYTNPENQASIRVLEKLGLKKQTITRLPGQDFDSLIMSVSLNFSETQ